MSDALRAGIAGLALPLALLAVLAALALGGAFGGLTSLGQLVVGPQVPLAPADSVRQASPPGGTGGPASALPAIPRLGPAGQGSPSAGRHAVHRFAVSAPRTPTGNGPTRPLHHPRPTPGRHGVAPTPSQPSPGGKTSPPDRGCGSSCPPKPSPNPVQQLVTKLQQSVPPSTPVPQSPADAINTIQQLSSSIATSGQKLVSH
jgi:hypothetical protein